MGEVVNFPKAKRPIPAGHETGEQIGERRRAPVFKPKWMYWKPDTATEDGGDGPDAA